MTLEESLLLDLMEWRKAKLQDYGINCFYYFSVLDNLECILRSGILTKNYVNANNIVSRSFAEETVQTRRHDKIIRLSSNMEVSIHDLVPSYLTPKTPTLSARRERQSDFFFVVVSSKLLFTFDVKYAFCDGNAASKNTIFFNSLHDLCKMPWSVIRDRYWTGYDDGIRKRNAEFLFFPKISTNYFEKIVVYNEKAKSFVQNKLKALDINIHVEINADFFF